VLILLLFSLQLKSQKILALDKPGKVKRIRYYEGDVISLKTDSGIWVRGEINRLLDSSLFIDNQQIHLSDIKSVQKTQKGFGWRLLAKVCINAASGYFLIDTSNRLINGDQPMVHEGTIKASGIMYGVFFISSTIGNRKYRINKNRTLKIIDISL
jgi:hypothetical protein